MPAELFISVIVTEVSTVSRIERTKFRKQQILHRQIWLVWGMVYLIASIIFLSFIRLTKDAEFLLELEIVMFFTSLLFLTFYLLGFMLTMVQSTHKGEWVYATAHPVITALFILSLFYHFFLWVTSGTAVFIDVLWYQLGVLLTLTGLCAALAHVYTFFSFKRFLREVTQKERMALITREAQEYLQRILRAAQKIKEYQESIPEIQQMLAWNFFDIKLERYLSELEPYFTKSIFDQGDVDYLAAANTWLENVILIIEQHPDYPFAKTKAN